jgi:hypothetical protein
MLVFRAKARSFHIAQNNFLIAFWQIGVCKINLSNLLIAVNWIWLYVLVCTVFSIVI